MENKTFKEVDFTNKTATDNEGGEKEELVEKDEKEKEYTMLEVLRAM